MERLVIKKQTRCHMGMAAWWSAACTWHRAGSVMRYVQSLNPSGISGRVNGWRSRRGGEAASLYVNQRSVEITLK